MMLSYCIDQLYLMLCRQEIAFRGGLNCGLKLQDVKGFVGLLWRISHAVFCFFLFCLFFVNKV